mmetsp:Transcript_22461/g.52123  ORF Transcript_22461/g.52123 Transcript_22461/m.52123 type:complete len:345 (+) Transcript_22461:104-1138(+)
MVRTHIGVKWPNIELKPLTGTIAYEVMTKRSIPGPGNYDPPMIGGPHGGKFNSSKSMRLIEQLVYEGKRLPGPGQYDGTYEPIDTPVAGYTQIHERSPHQRRRIGLGVSMSADRLPLSPSCMTPKSPMTPKSALSRRSGLAAISPHYDGPRSRSVDPYYLEAGASSSPLSARKGVTFGSQKPTAVLTSGALEQLMAQEIVKANGQYTGNHAAFAGVTHVPHRLATPKNRIRGPTLGGRARRMSQVTIVSHPTTVAGGAMTHTLFPGEQASHGMFVRHQAEVMGEHGIPVSREPSPERGGFAGISLCRTTRGVMDEIIAISPIDGRVVDGRAKGLNPGEMNRLGS